MDFELSPEERERVRRAAALAAGPTGRAALAAGGGAPRREALLAAQRGLAPGAGSVAQGLSVASESPALFLAAEATRHLADLLSALGGGLPRGELEALSRGERVGAVALADAAGGPPARLEARGGGWRLTGRKAFVTNAPAADWIAVLAEAEGGEAACLVAPGDAGVRVGDPLELLGLEGLLVAEVALEDAPLAPERVLGPSPGRAGRERYARQADLSLAVAAAGLMRGALRAANRWAHERQRDGRPLFARQEVAFKLAEVLALTEAAELLCHRADWLARTGDAEAGAVVRCAKVFCAESAERAASAGLQVMGGEGYKKGSAGERAYRDAKGLALAGTTTEVARMAIADELLSG
jgi:alkylation response protein AidB-like acyl-CoA dehydrogenase